MIDSWLRAGKERGRSYLSIFYPSAWKSGDAEGGRTDLVEATVGVGRSTHQMLAVEKLEMPRTTGNGRVKLGRNVSGMSRELGVTRVELLAKSSVSHLRK